MGFTQKDWVSETDHAGPPASPPGTPISGASLEDMEIRVTDYADLAGGNIFNVKEPPYNATGDGATDDTTALLAADTAAAAVGGIVYVPAGTFITTQLAVSASWVGQGRSSILKHKASAGGNTIYVNAKSGLSFRNFLIDGNRANATDAVGITCSGSSEIDIENVRVISHVWHGFKLDSSCARITLRGCSSYDCNNGIQISNTATDIQITDHIDRDSRSTTASEAAYYLTTGVTRVVLSNCHAINAAGNGFVAGATCTEISYTGCLAYSCADGGADLAGFNVASTAERISYTGCHAQDNGTHGFFAANTTKDVSCIGCVAEGNGSYGSTDANGFEILASDAIVSGCVAKTTAGATNNNGIYGYAGVIQGNLVYENNGDGIRIWDGNGVACIGNVVYNNSNAGVGSFDGIRVGHTTATNNVIVMGNRCFDNQGTPTQGYGINVTGTPTGLIKFGNQCAGNASGTETGNAGVVGFYGTAPIAQQTGVAVSAAGIHAALVNLGLITA